ncbi:hypothetical protein [Palleronia sp.]|uniref:hypothetical protein n=1 Tax=Palleronia sp. TaxID=1940284 RepID=UPI0035C79080
MIDGGYLRHQISRDELQQVDLSELSLEDAKALLLGCPDLNHLYVNVGDMSDPTFEVSEKDQTINRDFQEEGA